MQCYSRPQTHNQRIRTLIDLLKLFGKLDPGAAAKTLNDLTEELVAEVRNKCSAFMINEVP